MGFGDFMCRTVFFDGAGELLLVRCLIGFSAGEGAVHGFGGAGCLKSSFIGVAVLFLLFEAFLIGGEALIFRPVTAQSR